MTQEEFFALVLRLIQEDDMSEEDAFDEALRLAVVVIPSVYSLEPCDEEIIRIFGP